MLSGNNFKEESVGDDHHYQRSNYKGVVEHADPRRVEYEGKSKEELVQILLSRDAKAEQESVQAMQTSELNVGACLRKPFLENTGCLLDGVDQLVEKFSVCAKTIHQDCERNIEEGQKQIRELTDQLDVIAGSLKNLVFDQPAAKEHLSQQVDDERESVKKCSEKVETIMKKVNQLKEDFTKWEEERDVCEESNGTSTPSSGNQTGHATLTRIQRSHSKVDAVTNYMRAYGDSTTEMTGHNEELRTGVFSRTYGLQGVVAEIEEKNSLKKRLDEMEKLLKAHGIVEDVVMTNKKTLELFEKCPKELLSSAVEIKITDRQTELEMLRKELSEVSSSDEDISSQDCDMEEVEKELKLCEQFKSDLLDLVSGSPEEVSECVQETQCQPPQEGRQQLLEEVDGEPSQQCCEKVKPGEVHEEVSRHSGGLDESCKVDEAFQHPQDRIINEMEMVKKGLDELSKYFQQFSCLAKKLEEQGSRVKYLQERCAKWLARLREKDRKLERVMEENRKLKMSIATTQSQEETPIQRSLSKSSVMREGGDLSEYIDFASRDVHDVKEKFNQEMFTTCSPTKGEQEFGNPRDGSRALLVPGNSGPGTLRRLPSCFGELKSPLRVSERTPEDFMERFGDSFPKSVDAKAIATKLFNKDIIPDTLKNKIDKELSDQDASLNLYRHLKNQATFCCLTSLTIVMKGMIGYQRMIEMGNRMEKCLVEVGEFCKCKKHRVK